MFGSNYFSCWQLSENIVNKLDYYIQYLCHVLLIIYGMIQLYL